MTQQEYNDYLAHGGKWGYTNGIPNGKRKAVKKYMNSVGNYYKNGVGKYFKNGVGNYYKNGIGKYLKNGVGKYMKNGIDVQSKNLEEDFQRRKSKGGFKMTQQVYNDYLAHGGKWGYTNGIPNGKRKAVKKYMNGVGKNMKRFGEAVGDAFKERLSFNGALEVQNKNIKRALRKATSNPKSYRPNQKKEPVNTEVVELDGNLYEVKVSNRSAKAAEKKI